MRTPDWHKVAEAYESRGVSVVPLQGKKPFDFQRSQPLPEWNKPRIYPPGAWVGATGIGGLLGRVSNGLVDIDLDAHDLSPHWLAFFTKTVTFGREGIVRHLLYLLVGSDPSPSKRYSDPSIKRVIFELRGDGCQTMLPPSTHPNGERVEWIHRRPIAEITYQELIERCERFYAYMLKVRGVEVERAGHVVEHSTHAHENHVSISANGLSTYERARRYVARMDASVSGQSGHLALWRAALACIQKFGLSDHEALSIIETEFNPRCVDSKGSQYRWGSNQLKHKLDQARSRAFTRFEAMK
jgi:hypothetical protein